MEEYCEVMEPMAATLDVLQEEENFFYVLLNQCLTTLKNKLEKLLNNNYKFCGVLMDTCIKG